MNVAVVIATCGNDRWRALAAERAAPSAFAEAAAAPGRTVHISHYPELTVAEARNRAADEVPGGSDWFCFLDADDELEPGYLDAMVLFSQPLRQSGDTTPMPLLIPAVRYGAVAHYGIPNRGLWPRLNEAVIGSLVHRTLFEEVGGFRTHSNDGTELTLYEDWDLWLRCVDAGAKRVYVEHAIYRANLNPAGRNYSPDPQLVYDAIWRDHMARSA